MQRLPLLFGLLLSFFGAFAQSNLEIDPNDLLAGGTTRSTGNNCFRLTTPGDWKSGNVWYRRPIDLRQPFEMEMQLIFGCKDEAGADGMVFIFYPEKVDPGYRGEGMGFGGLTPSVGIEIDTYQNYHLADPEEDHVALMVHGIVHHYHSIAGPIEVGNLEDCDPHLFRINWEPGRFLLTIYLDDKLIIAQNINMLRDVFDNKPVIYWGVAAATGKKTNRHEICFEQLTFNEPRLGYSVKKKLQEGDMATLDRVQFRKGGQELNDASRAELDKLVRLLQEMPEEGIALYTHSVEGSNDKAVSNARADVIADYLISKGISTKRIHRHPMGNQFAQGRTGNWLQVLLAQPVP